MAGIVDGEGTFIMSRRPGISVAFDLKLSVSSTNIELLYWIQARFGGWIRKARYGAGGKPERWKQAYAWLLSGSQSAELASKLHEFLVIKKRHAEVFFRYRGTVRQQTDGTTFKTGVPVGDRVERMKLKAEMLELNKRGAN